MRSVNSLMLAGAIVGSVTILSPNARAQEVIPSMLPYATTAPAVQPDYKGRHSRHEGVYSVSGCPANLGCACNMAVRVFHMTAREAKREGLWQARAWAHKGQQAHKGCIGCVAVLSRGRRGGHVGIVEGYDASGNPVIHSYANARLGWTTTSYSSNRVIAYRSL